MQSIPCICSGRDCLLLSETGSGKTLSYIIPLIIRLYNQPLRSERISLISSKIMF